MSVSFWASRNCSWPTNSTNHSVPFSLSLIGPDARVGLLGRPLHAIDQRARDVIAVVMLAIEEAKLPATRFAIAVADQDAIGVVGDPRIALGGGRGIEQDAVDALARAGAEAGGRGLRRERIEARRRFRRAAFPGPSRSARLDSRPTGRSRTCSAPALLIATALRAQSIQKRGARSCRALLRCRPACRRRRLAIEAGEQRDVDLLAAVLAALVEVGNDTDDRVR